MFESLVDGDHVDNSVMVLGYVIMRVPMLFQWLRAARQDPDRARVCQAFIATLTDRARPAGSCCSSRHTSVAVMFALRDRASSSSRWPGPSSPSDPRGRHPWHPHHIAERYGLLVIITLGEGLLGTAVALEAVIGPDGPGWSTDVAVLRGSPAPR